MHRAGGGSLGPTCKHTPSEGTTGYTCIPMMGQGEALGVLHVHGFADAAQNVPELGAVSPLTVGGTSTVLQINTDDADKLWSRALEAGAEGGEGRALLFSRSVQSSSSFKVCANVSTPTSSRAQPLHGRGDPVVRRGSRAPTQHCGSQGLAKSQAGSLRRPGGNRARDMARPLAL